MLRIPPSRVYLVPSTEATYVPHTITRQTELCLRIGQFRKSAEAAIAAGDLEMLGFISHSLALSLSLSLSFSLFLSRSLLLCHSYKYTSTC
jgi:hypothetical protein